MKVLKLEISVKRYGTISVEVPDDFDIREIGKYGDAIGNAAREYGSIWDDPSMEPAEVESSKVLTGEALAEEIRDNGDPVDITTEIKEYHDALAKCLAEYEAKLAGAPAA